MIDRSIIFTESYREYYNLRIPKLKAVCYLTASFLLGSMCVNQCDKAESCPRGFTHLHERPSSTTSTIKHRRFYPRRILWLSDASGRRRALSTYKVGR